MEKFEQSWKEVLDSAEVSPASVVWNNIDRTLAAADGETMKRRIILYQCIAAASVLFAFLIGSFGIYRLNESQDIAAEHKPLENTSRSIENDKEISSKKNQQANSELSNSGDKSRTIVKGTGPSNLIASSKSNSKISYEGSNATNTVGEPIEKSTHQNLIEPFKSVYETANNEKINPHRGGNFSRVDLDNLGDLEISPVPQILEGPTMVDIVRKLPAIPGVFMIHNEKKATHERVWASVTAATGSYNPNISSPSNYSYTTSLSSTGSGAAPVGTSYSFGMLAGMRVARRVVLQSGIQYLNQSINSTSNISLANSLAPVANSLSNASQNYATTNPYSISSSNEFVSVPIQAGYLFIDKKMGLQLNSGMSADFFIRNTLSDPSGLRQSYSQSAGQDSPYRSVNFSGLLSSEVSYKMGNRYRVSVVPGFHYSLSPILKSTTNFSGNPFVWDVGFRFRYILR